MKKGDFIFIAIIIAIAVILIIPVTRTGFEMLTDNYPYLMGFLKTSILASMGELLASRIAKKKYFTRSGMIYRFIIWGFLGMGFVLMFKVFAEGVIGAMSSGVLPNVTGTGFFANLYRAFMISLIMNLIFAPTFMILHRVTDTYIDFGDGNLKKIVKVPFKKVIAGIEWQGFFGFVILKTIPIFWIPAHTITFMLPENYRVLMAGFLSIALGMILTLSKVRSSGEKSEKLS